MELRRILVVDDEPQLASLMARFLERLGFEVHAAAATEEAWEVLRGAPGTYALAVIDLTMPGLSGEDLARQALAADAALRVLLASGYATDLTSLQSDFGGRVEFLHKPFSADMLSETVRHLLRKPGDRRDVSSSE